MKRIFLLLMISWLVITLACKKSSEETTPLSKPLLMTINVTDDYFHPVLGGVIYISDTNGKLLSDLACTGNGTYRFYGKEGASLPPWIGVTIVKYDPYWHSFNIAIGTWTRIKPSEWTLQGSRADTVGSADPVFVNVPAHNGAILVSSSGYSNLTFTPGQFPIPLYKSPDDLYFGIPTAEGMRYKWISGIEAGYNDTLNLSGTLIPEKQTLRLHNVPVSYYECRVDGFPDGNLNNPVPTRINELLDSKNPSGTVDLFYPPGKFAWYHTDVMVVYDWASGEQYYYQTDGPIPSEFIRNSASLDYQQPSGYRLDLHSSGIRDAVAGAWVFQSPYQGMVEWVVFGPDTATHLELPEISPALNAAFPWLSRDSLTYKRTELIDVLNGQGYSSLTGQLFNPAAPSRFERLGLTRLVSWRAGELASW